jgi:hypothetical protein
MSSSSQFCAGNIFIKKSRPLPIYFNHLGDVVNVHKAKSHFMESDRDTEIIAHGSLLQGRQTGIAAAFAAAKLLGGSCV